MCLGCIMAAQELYISNKGNGSGVNLSAEATSKFTNFLNIFNKFKF
jgi:hypothetical protein